MLEMEDREDRSDAGIRRAPVTASFGRAERRGEARQVTLLRVGLIHAPDSKELCVVRNISPGGLSARVYGRLTVGEPVQVELRAGELLCGTVVRSEDWEVAIAFPEPIDVQAILAGQWITENGSRRNLPRVQTDCRARLRLGSRTYPGILCDISQRGAKVRTQVPVLHGGDAVLVLPDLPPLAGVVRWRDDTSVGLSLNERIPFEMLVRWIHEHRAGSSPAASDPAERRA